MLDFLIHDGIQLDDEFKEWIVAANGSGVHQFNGTNDDTNPPVSETAKVVVYVWEQMQTRSRSQRTTKIPKERPLSHRSIVTKMMWAPERTKSSFGGERVAKRR